MGASLYPSPLAQRALRGDGCPTHTLPCQLCTAFALETVLVHGSHKLGQVVSGPLVLAPSLRDGQRLFEPEDASV